MKNYMLDKVITWLLGGDLFGKIKDIVLGLSRVDVPGEEKRKIAAEKAKLALSETANFLINLAIEAAVYLLKQEALKAK
jgi:hypothetical protein